MTIRNIRSPHDNNLLDNDSNDHGQISLANALMSGYSDDNGAVDRPGLTRPAPLTSHTQLRLGSLPPRTSHPDLSSSPGQRSLMTPVLQRLRRTRRPPQRAIPR